MTAVPKRKRTAAECLAFEKSVPEKHEFLNGEVFTMAGGSREHNIIEENFAPRTVRSTQGRPVPHPVRRPAGEGRSHRAVHVPRHPHRLRPARVRPATATPCSTRG